MDVKYNTDTKIEDNSRAFKLQKANFDKEVNTAKAEAQLAYELQAAKIQQRIRNEEIQIQVGVSGRVTSLGTPIECGGREEACISQATMGPASRREWHLPPSARTFCLPATNKGHRQRPGKEIHLWHSALLPSLGLDCVFRFSISTFVGRKKEQKGKLCVLPFFSLLLQVVERRKQIEIEEQEIKRKEKELMSTVKLPAEAEAFRVQTIAEGKR